MICGEMMLCGTIRPPRSQVPGFHPIASAIRGEGGRGGMGRRQKWQAPAPRCIVSVPEPSRRIPGRQPGRHRATKKASIPKVTTRYSKTLNHNGHVVEPSLAQEGALRDLQVLP